MITRARAAVGALALALLVPAVAGAQPPRNPFADLFGRAPERTGKEFTAVQFRSSAGVQWGKTIEDDGITASNTTIPDGLSGGADASLIANYTRDRIKILGDGSYRYNEYRNEHEFGVPAFQGGIRADVKPTTRLTVYGGGRYTREPFFQSIWLPPDSAIALPVDRSAILLMQNDSVEGMAGLSHNYSKRSGIEINGIVRETTFRSNADNHMSYRSGRARWTHQLTRDLGMHFGYGREEMRSRLTGDDDEFTTELLDIGVDYSRSFSVARRMTLSFSTETGLIRENAEPRHFRVNGNVLLDRRFLRSWVTQLYVRRASAFLPGFRGPVMTDGAQLVLAGYLQKRLLLNVNADATKGHVGFVDPREYRAENGSAKLTFGLTQNFGVFTQYVYSRYENPPDALTLFAIPAGARHGVTVGVQTWISLYDKVKVPRDPR